MISFEQFLDNIGMPLPKVIKKDSSPKLSDLARVLPRQSDSPVVAWTKIKLRSVTDALYERQKAIEKASVEVEQILQIKAYLESELERLNQE